MNGTLNLIVGNLCREKRLALKSELQIRKKAMLNEDFPSQEIIDEFMQEPIDMKSLQLGWCQPNVVKFVVRTEITSQLIHSNCFMYIFILFRK